MDALEKNVADVGFWAGGVLLRREVVLGIAV